MPTDSRRRPRITLDGQLVNYWDREAARLDALAAGTRFGWQARAYARKAARARHCAQQSRAKEIARGNLPEPARKTVDTIADKTADGGEPV